MTDIISFPPAGDGSLKSSPAYYLSVMKKDNKIRLVTFRFGDFYHHCGFTWILGFSAGVLLGISAASYRPVTPWPLPSLLGMLFIAAYIVATIRTLRRLRKELRELEDFTQSQKPSRPDRLHRYHFKDTQLN